MRSSGRDAWGGEGVSGRGGHGGGKGAEEEGGGNRRREHLPLPALRNTAPNAAAGLAQAWALWKL